jgi:hypothetical protein
MLDDGQLSDHEGERVRELMDWFEANLQVPPCLKAGLYPKGVCWFWPTAAAHVAKMWDLVWLLRARDVRVQMLKTVAPGRVVYADDAQVVAVRTRAERATAAGRQRAVVW